MPRARRRNVDGLLVRCFESLGRVDLTGPCRRSTRGADVGRRTPTRKLTFIKRRQNQSRVERWYAARWRAFLRKPYVQIVFGARQTGKSTLMANPELRTRYLARPGDFVGDCRALPAGTTVFVDEAQAVPALFDAVQHLFDESCGNACGAWATDVCTTCAHAMGRRSTSSSSAVARSCPSRSSGRSTRT